MNIEAELARLEARIDRLESREAIRELSTAYGEANDQHDIPRLVALFTDDVVFGTTSGAMEARGREALEAMYIETFKTRGPSFHWTHDVVVHIDPNDADRAEGTVYSHAETSPPGGVSVAAMRYDDTYRRGGDGVWRFATRAINFLYLRADAGRTSNAR